MDALANFSPNSISRYVKSEWFRVPVDTGQPHVTGRTSTSCAQRVRADVHAPGLLPLGRPVSGIVGMDVTVQRLERGALPALRRIGERATLVNADGRAIVSAAPDIAAGDLTAAEEGCSVYPVGRKFQIWAGPRRSRNCRCPPAPPPGRC